MQGFQAHIRRVRLSLAPLVLHFFSIARPFRTQGVKLNETFASLVRASPLLELVTPPSLALSVFRLRPSSLEHKASAALNALNKMFYARVTARKDLYLTQTDLNGTFCVRMAIGATRTEERHIRAAFSLLEEEGGIALREWRENLQGDGPAEGPNVGVKEQESAIAIARG